ncbi:site-2 protease family protein [Metabacillus sp. HB246100]
MSPIVEFALVFLMMVAIILPFTTFIHELGHALTAAVLLKQPVDIILGMEEKTRSIRVGRMITIKLQPLSGWVGFFRYSHEKPMKKMTFILIMLSGPLFSLLLAISSYLFVSNVDIPPIVNKVIILIMNAAFIQCAITIIPVKYPSLMGAYNGVKSDGYQVVSCLCSKKGVS